MVELETAGDRMAEQQWVRQSLRQISGRLAELGHAASPTGSVQSTEASPRPVGSPPTVGRLLKGMDDALHVNAKKREAGEGHPDRGAQFGPIARQREAFAAAGLPIISVDTKKKQLIGTFRNAGRRWGREPEAVQVHDFLSGAVGRAVPYGIDDLHHNRGTVVVGTSADTAEFAVAAIGRWWDREGGRAFPGASELLILADAGGSNGCRPRLWKQQLQEQLCDQRGLTVTVGHYPTGCSKWNPIEHRLFGPISVNWAGQPLRTWETLLACLRGTTTTTGLEVSAVLDKRTYELGRTVSQTTMQALHLDHQRFCPAWNYTLRPRLTEGCEQLVTPLIREVVA